MLNLMRILATCGIFFYHFIKLNGYSGYRIDFFSILAFSFLSGYLASFNTGNLNLWFYKRIFGIMIPYWIIIVPIIIINKIFSYKKTSLLEDFITFFGGNLFLENPVYVIAWYITYINLLYMFIYLLNLKKEVFYKVFILTLGFLFFVNYLKFGMYFFSFIFGVVLSKFFEPPGREYSSRGVNLILFKIQSYCYSFFLIHGGVLIFFVHFFKLPFLWLLFYSFFISASLAVFLKYFSEELLNKFFFFTDNFFSGKRQCQKI